MSIQESEVHEEVTKYMLHENENDNRKTKIEQRKVISLPDPSRSGTARSCAPILNRKYENM